jgi:hypothetical protein
MKLFIFNINGQQIAEFYNTTPEGEILWVGDSWESFSIDTGYSPSDVGGLFLSNGCLTFSNTLRATAVNPFARLLSPIDKLNILTERVEGLSIEKQIALLAPWGMNGVFLALNAGNLAVAKGVVERIPVGEDSELIALKNEVISLLES